MRWPLRRAGGGRAVGGRFGLVFWQEQLEAHLDSDRRCGHGSRGPRAGGLSSRCRLIGESRACPSSVDTAPRYLLLRPQFRPNEEVGLAVERRANRHRADVPRQRGSAGRRASRASCAGSAGYARRRRRASCAGRRRAGHCRCAGCGGRRLRTARCFIARRDCRPSRDCCDCRWSRECRTCRVSRDSCGCRAGRDCRGCRASRESCSCLASRGCYGRRASRDWCGGGDKGGGERCHRREVR
mmetsp:Transcript_55618/g.144590  ORF Transcript_55618/g.144590 Transcript_55618/m.144590 type:complete len:241 (-) Transcript_55618:600-1322(-)